MTIESILGFDSIEKYSIICRSHCNEQHFEVSYSMFNKKTVLASTLGIVALCNDDAEMNGRDTRKTTMKNYPQALLQYPPS